MSLCLRYESGKTLCGMTIVAEAKSYKRPMRREKIWHFTTSYRAGVSCYDCKELLRQRIEHRLKLPGNP